MSSKRKGATGTRVRLRCSAMRLASPVVDAKVTTSASAQGNAALATLMATAAFRQYMPAGYDGHFVAFQNDQAKADVTKFLRA